MKLRFLAAALLLGGMAAAPARATLLDFENVPGLSDWGDYDGLKYYTYAGFDWSASDDWAMVGSVSEITSRLTGAHVGTDVLSILNAAQGSYFGVIRWPDERVSFSAIDGHSFSVNSGYFAGTGGDQGNVLNWEAVINGSTISGTSTLSSNGGTVTFNLANVSSFSFSSTRPVGFDNLDVGAVPEPTSAALTGLGLAALAIKRRRAQRKVAA